MYIYIYPSPSKYNIYMYNILKEKDNNVPPGFGLQRVVEDHLCIVVQWLSILKELQSVSLWPGAGPRIRGFCHNKYLQKSTSNTLTYISHIFPLTLNFKIRLPSSVLTSIRNIAAEESCSATTRGSSLDLIALGHLLNLTSFSYVVLFFP